LTLRITFREDTVPIEQAMILLDQLDAAMRDTLSFPETQATDTSLFPNQLLSIVPAKEESLHSEVGLLHQFVESQCKITPKRPALEFVTSLHDKALKKTWNYEELDAEGNKIANLLTQNGSLPADLITICFDKCPEASFAILGILKAGCAFVALDPHAPIARKLFIIKDSQSKCLLTTTQHALELQQVLGIPVICLDKITGSDSYSTPPTLPRKIEPSDFCYCLYTSGRLQIDALRGPL
jgi:ferricrocin synthase